MQFQKVTDTSFVLRLERGERIIDSIKRWAAEKQIQGASFYGIGAAQDIELAFYSLSDKKYHTQNLTQALEIASITGNISWTKDQIKVHAHGVFADQELHTYGGHIIEATVSVTCELFVTTFDLIERQEDKFTGLPLLKLSQSIKSFLDE